MHTRIRLYSWGKTVQNSATNPWNNSNVGVQRFYRHQSYTKTDRLYLNFRKCTLTVEYVAVLWVATLVFGENKMAGRTTISAKYMALSWIFMHRRLQFGNSTTQFCNATSDFDKCHYIPCLHAEFAVKHTKAPLSLTTNWKMEPDFGPWQLPDISCSHLYRGTIASTPPTVIYQGYTVNGIKYSM